MRAAQKGDLKISDGPNYIKETTKFIETFDQWIKCGQKLYEFGYELTYELVRTEIQQVAGIDLNTPMPSFYLTFDMDPPYILPDGLILDGILVLISESKSASSTKKIDLIFMSRPGKYEIAKPTISVSITALNDRSNIKSIFNNTINSFDQKFDKEQNTDIQDSNLEVDEAIRDISERTQHRRTILSELYQLIVGSILFLSTYHEKGKEGWSPNTPAIFVSKLSGRKQESAKATKWLADRGWSRSTFFNISPPLAGRTEVRPGDQVATYWRSGHWRRVAVGPNRCERRLTWIRPMLINANKGPIESKTLIISVNRGLV